MCYCEFLPNVKMIIHVAGYNNEWVNVCMGNFGKNCL